MSTYYNYSFDSSTEIFLSYIPFFWAMMFTDCILFLNCHSSGTEISTISLSHHLSWFQPGSFLSALLRDGTCACSCAVLAPLGHQNAPAPFFHAHSPNTHQCLIGEWSYFFWGGQKLHECACAQQLSQKAQWEPMEQLKGWIEVCPSQILKNSFLSL